MGGAAAAEEAAAVSPVTIAVFAALALFGWLMRRDGLAVKADQLRQVQAVLPLLDGPSIVPQPRDYPHVTGRYRGREVRIEPHTDSISVRKLPALWLQVSLRDELPVPATLDVMMRPRNVEYWSPFDQLAHELERPAGWPADANLRTDKAEGASDVRRLIEPHLGFLRDPRGKEILITPRGVRVTLLAAEGERGAYLLQRQAQFSGAPLDPTLVRGLLDRCVAMADAAKERGWT